jgi:hypothetical protein
VFERTQPGVQQSSSEWFGAWQPIDPLATAGSVALWRATRESGESALLRLYPRFQRQDTWRRFRTVAARRARLDEHPQLVAVASVGSYGRAHLLLDDPVGEPLATRIEREPLPPQVALRVFADVAAALDALAHAGVPPVELSPADIFVAGDRGLLLADVGTLGETLRGHCLSVDHAAPERVAMVQLGGGPIAQLLARLSPWHAPRPTTATMGYSFASVLRAALAGPATAGLSGSAVLPPRAQRVLDQTLAPRYRRRHRSPGRVVKVLQQALAAPEPERASVDAGAAVHAVDAADVGAAVDATDAGAERSSRSVVGRIVAVAAACVLAAAGAGAVTGAATTAPDPPGPGAIAQDGLSVQAPAGWKRVSATDAPFDAGASALVVQPGSDTGGGLTVTRSGQELLASTEGAQPDAVALPDGDAWRYAGAQVGGDKMDVYVLGTAAGPVVAACYAPGPAPLATCGGVVNTLRLRDAEALPLGGEPSARAKIAAALTELNRERMTGRARLAAAGRRPGQAAAAAGLARTYAKAGEAAAATRTVGAPGDQARLIARLEATSRSYSSLAAAARGGNAAAYRAARAQITEREQALRDAIAALAPIAE